MRFVCWALGTTLVLTGAFAPKAQADEGFHYGSYGRVGTGTDLRGSTPNRVQVVAHGSRVVENTYVELDFRYAIHLEDGVDVHIVTTPALLGEPFHYTGQFEANLALRNLYAEVSKGDRVPSPTERRVAFWIGSRMWRGDDIYLLDYWPLDNLNIVGAGAWWRHESFELGAAAGINRLLVPLQFQVVDEPDPVFGAVDVVQLDRQRYVAALQATKRFTGPAAIPGWKTKLYFEAQSMAEGERERLDGTLEELPSDFGLAAGAELAAWGFAPGTSHLNLFVRWNQGLTAYPYLAEPFGFNADLQTFPEAHSLVVGVSANVESRFAGVMVGGYASTFETASASGSNPADGSEWILDARPYLVLSKLLQLAADVSYQQRNPSEENPATLEAGSPAIFQLAPMLLLTPRGPGSYSRPQLRAIFQASWLNDAALALYPVEDARRDHSLVYFLGVQAEWWFNSTYP
jgi:maltoporin